MKRDFNRWEIIFVGVVFTAGLALRLRLALLTYLNPDEALHALGAFGTWGDALRNSIPDAHPPLLALITHAVSRFSRTELALRLVPVLAGSLFPLLLFAWLRRVAGRMAAMAALFLLTLAPHLITLSAQARSYTLAFLFLSASLVMLEEALEGNRWGAMAVFSVFLWLCILSDYSMAWFAGAVGVYAMLRLRGSSARVKATWIGGQLVAVSLFGLLLAIQERNTTEAQWQRVTSGWLKAAFPQPGDMLAFPFLNTGKQFAYLMASVPIGGLALVLFAVAVFWLWTGRTGIELGKARALAALLVLPFLLAIAGAYAHQFPYGRSRHTLVVGLFGAIGIAIFLETLPRRLAVALLGGTLLLTPVWHRKADRDLQDISADRNRKELILQCLDYMRATIPPGAVIFTERDTLLVLAYYDGHNQAPYQPLPGQFTETFLGGLWRTAAMDYQFVTPESYRTGLVAFRRQYRLGEREPVWVLDGGWGVISVPPDERRPFTRAVQVFQARAR
jgi:hypothetical protein